MTTLANFSDEEIFERAKKLHERALAGDVDAPHGVAACVAEARRRFGDAATLAAGLEDLQPDSKRAWWHLFWPRAGRSRAGQ
jgi:hypothetical protein